MVPSFTFYLVYIYIYIYIYIVIHRQTVSLYYNSSTKPIQLYVRLTIIPLSLQSTYVSSGIIRHYVIPFPCVHFTLPDTRELNLYEELCITRVAAVIYIYIYIYIIIRFFIIYHCFISLLISISLFPPSLSLPLSLSLSLYIYIYMSAHIYQSCYMSKIATKILGFCFDLILQEPPYQKINK